ncbi:Alkaline phosphatase synthesis transcriptional regulatory protein SphR [Hyella patelloides LEGE 07179]|uniref:Alkaline phosphatase synthesis transcriptional regulatory protein SphR n=1 Tax=Hyella patelloides LEGE 07179 TaxID=945734 RepID=A0A563VJ05_9CYAN|nr:response regulator transcription factor [Hyella patelloides]VEP11424.1 Alkaline phosphatase synthesis transcriptional regulatory protein SphR [Hyella patelloides LEGE 07179]
MEILIVEDEREIAEIIQECLEAEGFSCRVCYDGHSALRLYSEHQPDLVVLDLRLPGIDGLEVCNQIRQKTVAHDPYILMLTSRGEEIDRIIGLSTGADDYYVKPFSPRELVARVRALLRRRLREGDRSQLIRTKSFTIDLEQHCISLHIDAEPAKQLDLSSSEFKLMALFVKHPGRVWERVQLIEKLWGDDFFGEERVIDTHIARLRKKVEPHSSKPRFIQTVVGVGYKFEDL